MKTKKLLSFICIAVMILTAVQIPAFAEDVVRLDLSRNQTEFTLYDDMQGTLEVYGIYDDDSIAQLTDGLTYESSDPSVVAVDEEGNYEVLAEGATIITVKYGEITSSMMMYRSDEALPYRLNIDDLAEFQDTYVAPSNARFTQAPDPVYSTLFPSDHAAILEKGDIAFLKNMYSGTSYVIGAWVYDPGATVATFYFGFGEAAINASTGNAGTSSRYVRFGTSGTSGNNDKIRIFESSSSHFPDMVKVDKRVSRGAACWRQLMAFVNYDGEKTKIDFYLDGAFFGDLKFTGTIVPWKFYFPARGASTTLMRPLKDLFVAEIAEVEDAAYTGANISDYAIVDTDESFEFYFNRAIDTESENTSVAAILTETTTGENIEIDTLVKGGKVTVTPTYPLMPGREYEIWVSGTVDTLAGVLSEASSVTFDSTIVFETEKPEIYAEDLSLDASGETVDFTATFENSSGNTAFPYMVVSQFEDGLSKSVSAEKVTVSTSGATGDFSAEKHEDAESFEGYIVSSINTADVEFLAMPVADGTDCDRTELTSNDRDDSFADVSYNAVTDKVEVHAASKTMRAGIPVLVRIVNKGKNIADATEENIDDIYDRFELVETGEGGKLDYEFDFDGYNEQSGNYDVIVNMALEDAPFIDSLSYISQTTIREEIANIQNATPETAEEVFAAAREFLDLNYAAFDELENKSIIYSMLAAAEDMTELNEFSALFDECVAIVKPLEEHDFETIKAKCETTWELSDYSVYTTYTTLSTEKREGIEDDILDLIAEGKSLEYAFKNCMVMDALSAVVNYNQLYTLLDRMNDAIALDFTEYDALTLEEQSNAMLALSQKLADIDDISELKTEFEAAVTDAKDEDGDSESDKDEDEGNKSGGLNKGSGGGFTADITGSHEIPKEEVLGATTPEWVEEEKRLKERKVFDDLESVLWAEESIRGLYNMGVLSGKSERLFAPNDRVTREEICKMLVLALGVAIPENTQMPFTDTSSSAWYAPYVAAAHKNGIVNGRSETIFGTGDFLTREELCTLADRAAMSVGIYLDDEFTIVSFDDEMQISSWALSSVRKMRESLIVNGMDGNFFYPSAHVTRAQAAKIIYGVVQYAAE